MLAKIKTKSIPKMKLGFLLPDIQLGDLNYLKLSLSVTFSMVIGVIASYVVNATLLEISLNPFFSIVRCEV